MSAPTTTYPRLNAAGETVWACCESGIGPRCAHRSRCVCVRHDDGSVTTMLCPLHADTDPCLTMARVTGRRRVGTVKRGVCSSCGHDSRRSR
jgi:hypothetical protein